MGPQNAVFERGPADTADIDETRGDSLPEFGLVEFHVYKAKHSQVDDCDEFEGRVFAYSFADGLDFEAPRPPLHPYCGCYYFDPFKRIVIKFAGSEWEGRENG